MPISTTNNGSTLLLVATAAISATATAMAMGWYNQKQQNSRNKIPSTLLESPYGEQLELAVKLALQGMCACVLDARI